MNKFEVMELIQDNYKNIAVKITHVAICKRAEETGEDRGVLVEKLRLEDCNNWTLGWIDDELILVIPTFRAFAAKIVTQIAEQQEEGNGKKEINTKLNLVLSSPKPLLGIFYSEEETAAIDTGDLETMEL